MYSLCPEVTVDIGAIQRNFLKVKKKVIEPCEASAVVKSNSYGLGSQKVALALYESGCRNFWCAYLVEALEIRKVLPLDVNIFFFQGFEKGDLSLIKAYSIIPVINSLHEFRIVNNSGLKIALYIDTGFSRLGLRPDELNEVLRIMNNVKTTFAVSHLACSSNLKDEYNSFQRNEFNSALTKIRSITEIKACISASAGYYLDSDFQYDMIRAGAFLYGIIPCDGFCEKPENVVSLKAYVLQRYEIPEGMSVGYSRTFFARCKTKIAILSIGYADGIMRSLSNKGKVLFYSTNGTCYTANIVGNISMDSLACDVTNIPEDVTEPQVEAFLINNDYTVNDMAKDAGTIPYEIITNINYKSNRVNVNFV